MTTEDPISETAISHEEEIEEEKLINEEYKIWKKNAPYLYDLVVTHALEWPSLTIEWLPDIEHNESKHTNVQRLILGTNTSNAEPNYLLIASVTLPSDSVKPDSRGSAYNDNRSELGGYGGAECRIHVTNKIYHDGEVNRARYMPQNPCLIATRTVKGDVLVFDYTKHPSTPSNNEELICKPQLTLKGHTCEGFGINWNRIRKGYLVTCANDEQICIWDITSGNKENRSVSPLHTLKGHHTSVVEDVHWNAYQPDIFASVGDDRQMILWDLRQGTAAPLQIIRDAHASEINCVSYCPNNEHLISTGGADKTVALWDTRNLKSKVHSLEGVHGDQVLQVSWSPHHETILGSSGADRRVNIWDLSRIGMEQNEEDSQDGPPELLFVHGGHTNKVPDFSWNSNDPWCISTSSEDNIIQIWKPTSSIYENTDSFEDEDEEDLEDELEEAREDDPPTSLDETTKPIIPDHNQPSKSVQINHDNEPEYLDNHPKSENSVPDPSLNAEDHLAPRQKRPHLDF